MIPFIVTVQCPAIGSVTQITGLFNYDIPVTLTGSKTVVKPTGYVNSLTALCPVTYELIDTVTNVAITGTWLVIDASTGAIEVDGDTLGSKTVFVRYTYTGVATDMTT